MERPVSTHEDAEFEIVSFARPRDEGGERNSPEKCGACFVDYPSAVLGQVQV